MTDIENKIFYITGLFNTDALNTKDAEIENKASNTTNLATKGALSTKVIEINII